MYPNGPAGPQSQLARRRKAVLRSVEAYDNIRGAIVSGELSPGTVVTEAGLVRELDMSRTPVREALRRLQAERLLESVAGLGWVVVEVSATDLIDLYAVRAALEGLAAESAATRLTRMDAARLQEIYEAMGRDKDAGDDEALSRHNGEFHAAIATASGNRYLTDMLEEIRESFERHRMRALNWPGRRDDAHKEHGDILAALEAHDAATARALAEAHVRKALEIRRGSMEGGDGIVAP